MPRAQGCRRKGGVIIKLTTGKKYEILNVQLNVRLHVPFNTWGPLPASARVRITLSILVLFCNLSYFRNMLWIAFVVCRKFFEVHFCLNQTVLMEFCNMCVHLDQYPNNYKKWGSTKFFKKKSILYMYISLTMNCNFGIRWPWCSVVNFPCNATLRILLI